MQDRGSRIPRGVAGGEGETLGFETEGIHRARGNHKVISPSVREDRHENRTTPE